MPISFEQWCAETSDIRLLVHAMKSSLPEQYIGFYIEKALQVPVEYQKKFPWLGHRSLDIYIPSLCLAIEYDGVFYHTDRKASGLAKTKICRSNGVYCIRIIEDHKNHFEETASNIIVYKYSKGYKNIDEAVRLLFALVNKKYRVGIAADVDLIRDREAIISYVQEKYYKLSLAYVWPEIKDYWIDEENDLTIYDALRTNNRVYNLKCPNCGKKFAIHMRYFQNRKALFPCVCEEKTVEEDFLEVIRKYKHSGEIPALGESLRDRRLYDRLAYVASRIWKCQSKEEAELYKKLGFDSKYIDVYLEYVKNKVEQE